MRSSETADPLSVFAQRVIFWGGLVLGIAVAILVGSATPYDSMNPFGQASAAGLAFVSGLMVALIWLPLNRRQKWWSTLFSVLVIVLPPFLFWASRPSAPLAADNSLDAVVKIISAWVSLSAISPTIFLIAPLMVLICLLVASFVVLAFIALARHSRNPLPPHSSGG